MTLDATGNLRHGHTLEIQAWLYADLGYTGLICYQAILSGYDFLKKPVASRKSKAEKHGFCSF